MDTLSYTDKFVVICKDVLQDNLIGVYLHGSLAMSCFRPQNSDIDFLVIVKEQLTRDQSRSIANKVIVLHDEMPSERGVEFSIILLSHLNPFRYPTPFEFHYSDDHRDRYRRDKDYVCGGFEDEDLAAHFMVAYTRGQCLYGKPLKEVCEPIEQKYYLQSIMNDIKNSEEHVEKDPVYVILNLCRVLYYLEDGYVSSKKEGGEWGSRTLPEKYRPIILTCLDRYMGDSNRIEISYDKSLLFVRYAIEKINQMMEKI